MIPPPVHHGGDVGRGLVCRHDERSLMWGHRLHTASRGAPAGGSAQVGGMIVTVTLNPSLDEWCSLPRLRLGVLNRATNFARYAGGKGINVSRVVQELRAHTFAYALIGGDDGDILHRLMAQRNIPHDFVSVRGSTRNNYKIITEHPRTLTEINLAGPRVHHAALSALERRLARLRPRPACVVLSGSLPPGAPVGIYRRWIEQLRRRRIVAVLDTSGQALHEGLKARPWLIKPNHHEAGELLGRRLTTRRATIQAARDLLRLGPKLVILSLGKHGALLAASEPAGVWWATSPKVTVDSAVGSGDSLVAGFLVGWARRRPLLEAFRLGVASGSATAMTPGTQLCRRTDVRRLLPNVRVRQVG